MRSRVAVSAFSFYLALALLGCTSRPPADNSTDTSNPSDTTGKSGKESKEHKEAKSA